MQSNPMSYGYGIMFAVLMQQGRLLNQYRNEKSASAKLNNDKRLAGPSISKTPRDPSSSALQGKGKQEILSLKDFLPKED